MRSNNTQISGALLAEQDPVLHPQVAVHQVMYDELAGEYQMHVDDIMNVVAAGACKAVATPDRADGVRDVLVWRVDGDILDGDFDFAVRLAARVRPLEKGRTALPLESAIGTVYEPAGNWNDCARDVSQYGLLLLRLETHQMELTQHRPGDLPPSFGQARFTHCLPSGDVQYTARPQEKDPRIVLENIPPYPVLLRQAFGRFILDQAETVLDAQTTDAFASAAAKDTQGGYGPSDRHAEFNLAVRRDPGVSKRIHNLAATLYATGDNICTADLLNLMLTSNIAVTAETALLNKNAYYVQSREQVNPLLSNRLAWMASDETGQLVANLRSRLQHNKDALGIEIEHEFGVIMTAIQQAKAMHNLLQAPTTHSMDRPFWRVIAR